MSPRPEWNGATVTATNGPIAVNAAVQQPSEETMPAERSRRAIDTHAAFTAYLKRRVLAQNTPEMQRLGVALYRLLGRGAAVAREQLGAACGISPERLAQLLSEFPPMT